MSPIASPADIARRPTQAAPPVPLEGLFDRYLQGVLGDLRAPAAGRVTSCAICLAAFAELGRLGAQAPAAALLLTRLIRSGRLAPVDLWVASAALCKIVSSEPVACFICKRPLMELTKHSSRHVRRDASLALSLLRRPQATRQS